MKRKIGKVVFAVVSCGLIIQAAFPIHTVNAQALVKQEHNIGDIKQEIVYLPNTRMEEVPAELLDDTSAENPIEGLEEDSTVSPYADTVEWRITSASDWDALLDGRKSPDWSNGSYTGGDDVTVILESDIVTDRTSIYLTQENVIFTLDLNGHTFQSSTGIMNVNSINNTGGKRIANSFVLCNGRIVNTCIDTSNAMENVDIHGVDFTDMDTNAIQGAYSNDCIIHDCSFSHRNIVNTDTAIAVPHSGSYGKAVQIYNVSINGFQNGINCSYNTGGTELNHITVSGAEMGIELSYSGRSTITDSTLQGNQRTGSRGVVCNNLGNSISLQEFLYAPSSNMSRVTISGFDSGVRVENNGTFSLDNCEITNVNYGLDGRSATAQFNIRDSILTANASVAGGSYTGDSYGIYATLGYFCVNTEVAGFKVGAYNNLVSFGIANCTFDNLECNVDAYSGGVYNSILRNATIGFRNNTSTPCLLVDTVLIGNQKPGSIGVYASDTRAMLYVMDTATFSPDGLNANLDILISYVQSQSSEAPSYDMMVSNYDIGLLCNGNQMQIADIEVKNCSTGIKGNSYYGYTKNGESIISNNYVHDCEYGVDCDSFFLRSNLYIYNCSQIGMQIHSQLTEEHLVEIYNCKDGLVFDGNSLTGTHLRIHDNTGNGLFYTGGGGTTIDTTMEIYNNDGWNICGNDINTFHLSYDQNQEFICRLENGGLGNMNIRQTGSSGANYTMIPSCLKSDDSVYYVYPGKEVCIRPHSDNSWTDDTDWLQGSMVFDTEEGNYTEGAVAAYIPSTFIRTQSDIEKDTWDFVQSHFFAAKEGWIIRYDTSASPVMTGYPLVFTEGCNVTYDYETNGGTSIQSNYEKVTYLKGDAIDLSITAERPGYEFLGWSTNPDAHAPLSALTAGQKNITLYAIYRKEVTFTYHTYNPLLDYTQDGYIFNQETVPYADQGGTQALKALSYAEQIPQSDYVYAGYSFDGKNKTDLFQDDVISSSEQTDIYCVYVINGVLSYLRPDGAVDHQQTVEAFYSILDTLPYQFSYVLHSFRPEQGYVFSGWRDTEGRIYAPGSTYLTTRNPAELQAEVTPIQVASLVVSPKHSTISIGETLQMTAIIQPEDALNSTVTWTTSDASIATIDANGLVTAHAEGTVTITATANDGSGCFDTATVVVIKEQRNPSSQPKTGDDFPMAVILLLGCFSMLMAILSIFNLGKRRGIEK